MKKTLFYLIFSSAVVVAYMMGSLNASVEVSAPPLSHQQQEFSQQVERYQPSCEQLTQLGQSARLLNGDDTVVVYTTENNFYVFGVNFSPQNPPFSHWWGGDRQAALESCRAE